MRSWGVGLCVAASVVAAAPAAWALNTTNLIGYYRFDERDATTTVRDDFGQSNGTMMEFSSGVTGLGRVVGKYRGAVDFDGANTWVKIPDNGSNHLDQIATNNAFTISAWVRADEHPTGWAAVVSRQKVDTGSEHYLLGFADGYPGLIVSTASYSDCFAGYMPTGIWVHYAATFDGATDTGRLYVNGEQVCTLTNTGTLSAEAKPLIIGGNSNGSSDDAGEIFDGQVDDVLIYSRALTKAEIAELANGAQPLITKYWLCATGSTCDSFDDTKWSLSSNGSNNTTAPWGPYQSIVLDGGSSNSKSGSITTFYDPNVRGISITSGYTGTHFMDIQQGTNGLTATYYNDIVLSNWSSRHLDANIDFSDMEANGTTYGGGNDTFSVRWSGQIKADATDDYKFHTYNDDGIRVYLDNVRIIDAWWDQGGGTPLNSAAHRLEAGRWYDLMVEYYDNANSSKCRLLWSRTGSATQVAVPTGNLRPTPYTIGAGGFSMAGGTFWPPQNWWSVSSVTLSGGTWEIGPAFSVSGNFTMSGGLYKSPWAAMEVGGDFNFSSGTFNAPSAALTIGGKYNQTGGTFTHNNGTVVLSSAAAQNLTATGGNFYNLTVGTTFDPNAMVSRWDFEEGSGTRFADRMGTFHATAVGNVGFSSTVPAAISSFSTKSLDTTSTTATVWHSYNAYLQAGSPQGFIRPTTGNLVANLQFYTSTNTDGIADGDMTGTFQTGTHPDTWMNMAAGYWAPGSGYSFPVFGKSSVARGSDVSETNTPSPTGVYDLMLHPPDTDYLAVAAFVAPVSGTYTVKNLGVRRVSSDTREMLFRVFNSSGTQIASLTSNSRAWVTSASTYALTLNRGDRIYFAADRSWDSYAFDAMEVNWTVELTGGTPYIVANGAVTDVLKGTATLTAWIKTGVTGSNTAWLAPALASIDDNPGSNDVFWGYINGTGKLCIAAGNGTAACSTTTVNGNSSWYFVALTRDATTGAVEVYVGNTREGTATSSTGTSTLPFAHLLAFLNTVDGTYVPFKALVDDLRIYNRVLTSAEIAILAGGSETGTMAATHTAQTGFTANNDLTISTGGTLAAGANTINVKGNWTNSGTFTANTSTVAFTGGASGKTITPGTGSFYNLTVNGTNGGWTVQADTTVTNNLTLTAGALSGSNRTINVAGDWLNNGGTFTPSTSTVNFNGSSVSKTITPNANAFHHLTINGSSSTYTLGGALDCNGNLTVTAGTLATSNHAVVVGGSITKTGTITPGTSTLTLDGSGTGNSINIPGGSPFASLTISGSGDWTANGNFQIAGDVAINNGTLYGGSSRTLTVGGSWTASGSGSFVGQTSIVNLNASSGTKTISGANTFNRLEQNGAATYQLGSALDVNGDLVINGPLTVGAGNHAINVGGSFSGTGTFTAGTGTVTLDGATGGTLSTASHFYNLAVTGAGTWTLGQALYVDNDLTFGVGSGSINTNASSSYHIYVAKNLNMSGGALAANSATVHLTAASGSYTLNTNGSVIPTLSLDAAGTWNIAGSTTVGTLTQGTGNLNGGTGTLTIQSGWTRSSGTFTPSTGTVSLAGGVGTRTVPSGLSFYNLDIATTGGGVWQLGGNVAASNAVTIQSGGTLNLHASGAYTLSVGTNFTNSGTIVPGNGTVDFTGSGGTINAGTNGSSAQFYNLKVSGAGTYTLSTSAVTVSNDLLLAGGTLAAGAVGLTVNGHWNNTAGNYTCSGNTVTLGGTSKNITPNARAFCGLTINTGASYTQQAALAATGDLNINGTLATGSNALTVGGSLVKGGSGTFTPGTSLVTLNGTTSGKTLNVGSTALDRLTISGSGGEWTLGAATTVTNALSVGPGSLLTGAFQLTNNASSAATVASSGTLSIGGNGSAVMGGGLTVASGGTLTLTGTAGQSSTLNLGSGRTLTINGTFNANTASVTKTLQASSGYYGITVNGSGSAAVLNIDGLEVKNTDANGFTINSASAATFTSFKNIDFTNGNPTASRYLSIDANSLNLWLEGLTFDAATTSNVRLVGHGTGLGTVRLTLRSNNSGAGAGESRDIDDDGNEDDVADNSATNGAVISWLAYHTDLAGTLVTFPIAAFDWNSFQYYSTYVAMKNVNVGNDDYIYVRNADGSAKSYGFAIPNADGDILGAPRPIQSGSTKYLIVLTTTGKVFKLVDNETSTLDKVSVNWPYNGYSGCATADTPPIATSQYVYWACSSANGKDKWMLKLDHTVAAPNTTGPALYQYANNSNTIKIVTPAPAIGTVSGTEYIYFAAQAQAYGLPTGTFSSPLTDTTAQPAVAVNGRITFYGGRVYYSDDNGKLWVKNGGALATNHWVYQDLATHSNSCSSANCKMANFTVGFKTGNSTYPRVYWGDADGHVYAVYDNGSGGGTTVTGFPFQPSGSTAITAAPAYDAGVIVVGNTAGEVFVINQRNGSGTREVVKTYTLGSAVSSISVDQSNNKYHVVSGTRLFALPRYTDSDGQL